MCAGPKYRRHLISVRVRKAVLPAAGFGTRFLPATKAIPKEVMPLVDRPIIQYAVEEAVASGIEQIIIVISTGRSAIEILQGTPDIDIVLMDIMMPDMDGFDTMRAIRKLSKFRSLPIIALTAKAMKGDREKCIEAGASDYISKPVDNEQLLAMLRVWLYR